MLFNIILMVPQHTMSSVASLCDLWAVLLTPATWNSRLFLSCCELGISDKKRRIYFFPVFFSCVSLRTFFTIFCSSIRNARTIRSLTQFAHLEPPYALDTDFWVLDVVAYCLGLRAGTWNSSVAELFELIPFNVHLEVWHHNHHILVLCLSSLYVDISIHHLVSWWFGPCWNECYI